MAEWESSCLIGGPGGRPAQAHVVAREYSPDFTVWYGSLAIEPDAATPPDAAPAGAHPPDPLVGRPVELLLPDGRSMLVWIPKGELTAAGRCHFVSVAPLQTLQAAIDKSHEPHPPSR